MVTADSASLKGEIYPEYPIISPVNEKEIWDLIIPPLSAQESFALGEAGGCGTANAFCTTYAFRMPSQKPITVVGGKYVQQSGVPVYLMTAIAEEPLCTPNSVSTSLQQSETAPLLASPGSSLVAETLNLIRCK